MEHNGEMPADDTPSLPRPLTLATCAWIEELFDRIPDIVFFLKDLDGRYVSVNRTLVERCGLTAKAELVGRTSRDVFPPPLGERYLAQDRVVCATGTPITARLELHLFPGRREGWCLTDKVPVRGADGRVVGLAGLSRDLRVPPAGTAGLEAVAAAAAHIESHVADGLRVEELAGIAGMSPYQFNRRVRAVFGITAQQLVAKTRIDTASRLLRDTREPIAVIATACGYCDQSAFTRQFRAAVGLTPRQYRDRAVAPGG